MDQTTLIVVIVVVAVAIVALVGWSLMQRRRSEQLQERFGPEYSRTVGEYGDKRRAEAALGDRVKRVERYNIRPLTPDEHSRFSREWKNVQARFVDEPPAAVSAADRLVASLMSTRGYPMGEFDQRAADISVDHPAVVEHYRAAHGIVTREGKLSTEDLREAMVHYRALFDELLETGPAREAPQPREEREPEREQARR
jgi:hypothetical protein